MMVRPVPPLVSALLIAALWAAAAWRFGMTWELPAYLYLATISVPLAVIDLRTLRLPNAFTLSAYPIVAALLLLPAIAYGDWPALWRAAIAGVALLACYVLLHVINPSGMGMGDVKLSGPLGALLGWVSWEAVLLGTLVGFILAAATGVALIVARRAGRKSALPFGPFMLAGAWIAILTQI
jgi:leader peptidase (prepilin peptidase) / N-methyltransferase